MPSSSFDATHAIQFDLTQGSVCAGGQNERLVLVPSSALSDLVASGGEQAAETLGRKLGGAIGSGAAARVTDLPNASIETFVTQLAGQAAILGVGSLSLERWGRALVVVLERCPLASALIAPLVAAAFETASGRQVWCLLLAHEQQTARVLVASKSAVARADQWLRSGVSWRDAVSRLHGGAT